MICVCCSLLLTTCRAIGLTGFSLALHTMPHHKTNNNTECGFDVDKAPLLSDNTRRYCVVFSVAEYLCEPLRKCLKDEDPYVRKTAAVCVAKLHDINASLVEDQGFLDLLRDLLSDSNPMVSE